MSSMSHYHLKRRAHGGWRIIRTIDGRVFGWMRTKAQALTFAAMFERAAEVM